MAGRSGGPARREVCSVCGKQRKPGTGGSRYIRIIEGGPVPFALYFYCSAPCHDRFQRLRSEDQWKVLKRVA